LVLDVPQGGRRTAEIAKGGSCWIGLREGQKQQERELFVNSVYCVANAEWVQKPENGCGERWVLDGRASEHLNLT